MGAFSAAGSGPARPPTLWCSKSDSAETCNTQPLLRSRKKCTPVPTSVTDCTLRQVLKIIKSIHREFYLLTEKKDRYFVFFLRSKPLLAMHRRRDGKQTTRSASAAGALLSECGDKGVRGSTCNIDASALLLLLLPISSRLMTCRRLPEVPASKRARSAPLFPAFVSGFGRVISVRVFTLPRPLFATHVLALILLVAASPKVAIYGQGTTRIPREPGRRGMSRPVARRRRDVSWARCRSERIRRLFLCRFAPPI